jgi:hypothetical protein
MSCGAVVAVLAALLALLALPADAAPDAAAVYRAAIATTKAWTVHYASTSDVANNPFVESGNAGPASGTQTILAGKGTTADRAALVVIGDLTYIRGNEKAMEDLAGLAATQAAADQGRWVLFSTNNPAFAQVVAGVRSKDVTQEIALNGPYTYGRARKLDGYKVDAIRGTQKLDGAKKTNEVLYVRAAGRHLLVEEDSAGAQGKPNGLEHIVFSKWGEAVRPRAPEASITIGSINSA